MSWRVRAVPPGLEDASSLGWKPPFLKNVDVCKLLIVLKGRRYKARFSEFEVASHARRRIITVNQSIPNDYALRH